MTSIDPKQTFDTSGAASSIGALLSAFHSLNGKASNPSGSAATLAAGQTPTTDTAATTTDTATSGDTSFGSASPVPEGTPVTQGYGVHGHPGIDLGVPLNTTLLAAAAGKITHSSNDDPGGYGEWVEITTPDGTVLRYGHLHTASVNVGDSVKAGQPIGTSGGEQGGATSGNSEGPHLHFEVRQGDHTVDPTPWLAGGHPIVSASPTQVSVQTPVAVAPQDAVDTAANRLTDTIAGKGDPGSQNQQKTTTTTSTTSGNVSGDDGDPAAVEGFLAATRQHESGGNYTIRNQSGQSNAGGAYQFLGSTWQGLGGSTASAADAPPAEQDAIARRYAMQLFSQFHSWRLVAIAWYGGPGIAQQVAAGQDPGSPQGQGSYTAYGDTIAKMMAGGK